jgi:Methyltransferase domain
MNWDEAPDFGRRETLLKTLRRLYQHYPEGACIVETGTLRSEAGLAGDGWSTVAWGWYCHETGGTVHTVDIDAGNLEVCRRVTAPYAAAIEYVHADSVTFLRQWAEKGRGEIHLLYQDSFDYLDHAASEAHHLAEAQAALPLLATPCLVLFDDSHVGTELDAAGIPRCGGKGAKAIPFLLEHGFRVEWSEGGQVQLSRGLTESKEEEDGRTAGGGD